MERPGTMERLCRYIAARRPARRIDQAGADYLERFFLFQVPEWRLFGRLVFGRWAGGCAYLHRFLDSDDARGLHDHPWPVALSVILAGHYDELRLTNFWSGDTVWRPMGPGCLNLLRRGDFHRVVLRSREAWTLFVHARPETGWGFIISRHGLPRGDYVMCEPIYKRHAESATAHWWRRADCPRGRDLLEVRR